MSFIYDNQKLLDQLTRAGDDFLSKYGQATDQVADPNAYAVGSALLSRLQKTIDPKSAPANTSTVGTANGTQPALGSQDIKSLNDFLKWASDNQVTWQGKRVAWNTDPTTLARPPEAPEDAWVFEGRNQAAYASKPELVSLLSYLRDSDESRGNRILQSSLTKVINQANEYLVREKEAPLDTKPKAVETKTTDQSGLNPESIIDGFASNVLDPNDPYRVVKAFPLFPGLFSLKVKDISSFGAFTAWLQNMSMVTKAGTVPVVDPKGDPCVAVHVLYKRAQWLSQYAASAEKAVPGYTKMVALYLQKLVEYGRQLHGPDGKPCAVVSEGTTTVPAGEAASGNDAINRLVQASPLRMRDVDFQRIKTFFDQYQGILGSQRGAGVQTAIQNALTAIQQIQAPGKDQFLVNPNMSTFSLSASPGEVKTWLSPPQGRYYLTFLDHLKSVLSNTAYVLRDLQNAYADDVGQSKLDDNMKNILSQQVGAGMGSGSIYGNNWNQISRLEQAVKL